MPARTAVLTTRDGVRLHAEVRPGPEGAADWVVLAHGFSGSTAVPAVRRVAERLARRATVLAYDARGHGGSGGLCTLGDREVLDVDAAVVVRHAARAAHAPVQRPDAVVVVSGTGPWSTWGTASPAMRRLHLLVETRLGRLVTRVVLRTRVDPHGRAVPPVPPAECVRALEVPLLVVHGDRDHYLGLEHACALAGPTGAPLWVEPGLGHAEIAMTPELVDRVGAHLAECFTVAGDGAGR